MSCCVGDLGRSSIASIVASGYMLLSTQPETAKRSFEEIDELFINLLPAWKFAGYKTNVELIAQEAKGCDGKV
ncbi:hypothetical protein V502_01670 [Pseudogymnoascus sp. VKM F-4520 (FW-2644)]|nr:hypothetical protein V502_01670 [Pseudogymnoascus sp. VKM F-4520 (FW-2644)]